MNTADALLGGTRSVKRHKQNIDDYVVSFFSRLLQVRDYLKASTSNARWCAMDGSRLQL